LVGVVTALALLVLAAVRLNRAWLYG
jgi:hypothetical protein